MAEEKITIVDLRKAIAKQTEIEEAQVNAFLNQLIATIKDGLRKDKLVKISGLGTFKLQWVEPRKSVNISTGEPIVIEGYQKLSFTPEQSVKERINEPYADLMPMILDEKGNVIEGQEPKSDPMQKFDEQALEIKDILADLGADLTKDEPAETETKVEEVEPQAEEPTVNTAAVETAAEIVETPTVETPEVEAPKVEEPEVETPEVEAPKVEEPKVETPEAAEEPKVETPEAAEVSSEKKSKEEKKEKPFRGWLVAIITVLSLIILLFICGLFLQNKIEEWADMLNGKIGVEETMLDYEDYSSDAVSSTANTVVLSNDSANTEAVTDSATAENGDSSALAEADKPLPKTDFYKERIYTEFIGFETVREGSRLTWIAKKFYDNKELWVFIYEANRDKIKNPSTVTVGTQLKIPALPDEFSDPNNMKAQHLIKKLQEQYLNQ